LFCFFGLKVETKKISKKKKDKKIKKEEEKGMKKI
jgi:hypothetical protein